MPERGKSSSGLLISALKLPFVGLHIDFPPTKAHAFGFEPKPLFDRGIAAQLDFTAGAKHPLPG